jgi:hypothetical protein
LNGLAEVFNNIKESKYASQKKEPLGQGYQRGYNWPQQAQNGAIAFGVATVGSESAKDVLYPQGGAQEERNEFAKMYTKTHGNFAPGE